MNNRDWNSNFIILQSVLLGLFALRSRVSIVNKDNEKGKLPRLTTDNLGNILKKSKSFGLK